MNDFFKPAGSMEGEESAESGFFSYAGSLDDTDPALNVPSKPTGKTRSTDESLFHVESLAGECVEEPAKKGDKPGTEPNSFAGKAPSPDAGTKTPPSIVPKPTTEPKTPSRKDGKTSVETKTPPNKHPSSAAAKKPSAGKKWAFCGIVAALLILVAVVLASSLNKNNTGTVIQPTASSDTAMLMSEKTVVDSMVQLIQKDNSGAELRSYEITKRDTDEGRGTDKIWSTLELEKTDSGVKKQGTVKCYTKLTLNDQHQWVISEQKVLSKDGNLFGDAGQAESSQSESGSQTEADSKENEKQKEQELLEKAFREGSLVIDADLSGVSFAEHYWDESERQYCHVPSINTAIINGPGINQINEAIMKAFTTEMNFPYGVSISYEAYKNEDTLSVLIRYSSDPCVYRVFNVSLEKKELISDDNLLRVYGISRDNYGNLVQKAQKAEFWNRNGSGIQEALNNYDEWSINYYDEMLQASMNESQAQPYLNGSGQLWIATPIRVAAGMGETNTCLNLSGEIPETENHVTLPEVEAWKKAYIDYIKNMVKNSENVMVINPMVILLDLDGKGCPELLIDTGSHVTGIILGTYSGGEVTTTLVFGGIKYRQGENLLLSENGYTGYFFDTFYSIKNGSFTEIASGQGQIGEDGARVSGTCIWDNKEVSPGEYEKNFEQMLGTEYTTVELWSGSTDYVSYIMNW